MVESHSALCSLSIVRREQVVIYDIDIPKFIEIIDLKKI
jgi:hypothetical protein